MSCSISFTIDKDGKLITKAKWNKPTPKKIARFRKFLLNLQSGNHNIDVCKAILKYGEDNLDINNARKILKVLTIEKQDSDEPIILPQDIGGEINEQE